MPKLTKTRLITGTTHGIGLATARAIAGAGYTVVMANRDQKRTRLVEDHVLINNAGMITARRDVDEHNRL